MDNRPRFHWRRRSVFVTVFLVVMIASAISVLAATGSTSGKRYYACVAGQFKTLNLTTADATELSTTELSETEESAPQPVRAST